MARFFGGFGLGIVAIIAAFVVFALLEVNFVPVRTCLGGRVLAFVLMGAGTAIPVLFMVLTRARRTRSATISMISGFLVALYLPFIPCTLSLIVSNRCP